MPVTLSHEAPDFERRFDALLDMKRESSADVDATVAGIIEDVATRGLDAVIELTRRFDRWEIDEASLAFTEAEIDAAIATVPAAEMAALELAAERITAYHARQLPEDDMWEDAAGVTLGWRWTPVDAAGLYVPGGLASYPSSVLMNAIPAQVAGVRRIEICAPTPDGRFNPLVLAAARLGGASRVWRIGGAQAIAAMAYGAGPIRPVDKITGPGNAYVAAAKRRVFGRVGIDMIAGPSEILVIADAANDPDWVATDLLSQAEHDESAQSILITTDAAFGAEVARAVDRLLQRLERTAIAGASWRDFGAVVVARDLTQAAELANRIAPEHLELCVANPEHLMGEIRHAGAIFLGRHTPEAIGDYVGGPNHVLPTARSARFSSGLSVLDYMKRTTIARVSPRGLAAIGPAAETLARSESLEAHALSVRCRLDAQEAAE
ncbi:histidinol dehydrogenase [Limibaculum sp. M0105]|uniref:Histidinol dehydrogenase n=1 Tax=Thermohalobaculum xanthum TaxID=2753746 RepID=A0A8J7M4I7_9RHOB|nr:histidinol dehydrogenase [Thermohalobaculum xanthum]MBK0398095.1 histidinol dehydrogenase [Thermohalobaculum xanthum]